MALVQIAQPEMNLHRKTMVAGEPAVKMRVVPELHFIVDDVEEKAERMMKLFEQIEGDGSDAK